MTFLPLLVLNFLLASFVAHFAFRFFDEARGRALMPARVRAAYGRNRRGSD